MTGEIRPGIGQQVEAESAHDLESTPDWQLLSRAEVEPEALAVLFLRHRDFVYRVAFGLLLRRDLAEDAVQEVFLRLAQRSASLQERAGLRTLLYGFTLNVARENRRVGFRESELVPEKHDRPSQPEGLASSPLVSDVWNLLPKLPRRQREVVVLRLLEGLTTREAAEALGCGEGSVKTHLHRATRALREHLSRPSRAETGGINTSQTVGE